MKEDFLFKEITAWKFLTFNIPQHYKTVTVQNLINPGFICFLLKCSWINTQPAYVLQAWNLSDLSERLNGFSKADYLKPIITSPQLDVVIIYVERRGSLMMVIAPGLEEFPHLLWKGLTASTQDSVRSGVKANFSCSVLSSWFWTFVTVFTNTRHWPLP